MESPVRVLATSPVSPWSKYSRNISVAVFSNSSLLNWGDVGLLTRYVVCKGDNYSNQHLVLMSLYRTAYFIIILRAVVGVMSILCCWVSIHLVSDTAPCALATSTTWEKTIVVDKHKTCKQGKWDLCDGGQATKELSDRNLDKPVWRDSAVNNTGIHRVQIMWEALKQQPRD